MTKEKWRKRHLNARRRKIRRLRFRRALSIFSLLGYTVADVFLPGNQYSPLVRSVSKLMAAEALRRKRKELKENA